MAALTYEIDETPVVMPNGEVVWLSGSVEVEYTTYAPDRSIGEINRGAGWCVVSNCIETTGFNEDGDALEIVIPALRDPRSPFQQMVEKNAERIERACVEDYEYGTPVPCRPLYAKGRVA